MIVLQGTILYATLIATLTSINNIEENRDSAMYEIKKGNQWFFVMKVHAGVDMHSGLIHLVVVTAANFMASTQL